MKDNVVVDNFLGISDSCKNKAKNMKYSRGLTGVKRKPETFLNRQKNTLDLY